jgi:hypothetical protein
MNLCARIITCREVFMTISHKVKNNAKESVSQLAILSRDKRQDINYEEQ